jgi:putative flippase GtrA
MNIEYAKIIKFIFSGGTAALVNLVSRWIFSHYLYYSISIILAYILGLITAFVSFKFFVFESGKSGKTKNEIIFFVAVNIIAMIQTLVISLFLADILFPYLNFTFHPYDIAHVIGVMIPVISSYILHNKFTFQNKSSS